MMRSTRCNIVQQVKTTRHKRPEHVCDTLKEISTSELGDKDSRFDITYFTPLVAFVCVLSVCHRRLNIKSDATVNAAPNKPVTNPFK